LAPALPFKPRLCVGFAMTRTELILLANGMREIRAGAT
jgi:hypothetical protein